jgi:hemolysin activation/secretion protein
MQRLEEAIAILNDQPGVQLSASLKTGSREGEVDVDVIAADKPLVGGAVGINNNGSRGSGVAQAQGALTLSNPTGHFDAASLLVNASEGNTYGRVEYSLAAGSRGLRLGVNAAHLDYRVIQSDLKPLDLHGSASTYGLTWSYPLARTGMLSWSLAGSYDVKKLVDQSAVGETGNREVKVASLGTSGGIRHRIGSLPASTVMGATLFFGDSEEHNAGALAADNAARQVNGSFSKLSYTLANVAELGGSWSSNIALRGQFAGENIDSSERLSLGGPTAVRAYPSGEGTGDEGWLFTWNLRRTFGNALATSIFYDAGGITLNKTTWANWNAGNPNLPNRYTLAGMGVGLDWRIVPSALLAASIAAPLGSNPGRDTNNNNVDGHGNKARVWISLNAQF